jgi:hypothetical protein
VRLLFWIHERIEPLSESVSRVNMNIYAISDLPEGIVSNKKEVEFQKTKVLYKDVKVMNRIVALEPSLDDGNYRQ